MKYKKHLYISLVISGLLFLPKFHRPPLEFQSQVLRISIEVLFFLSIAAAAIFKIKNNQAKSKLLAIVFGSLILIFIVGFGLFFTFLNKGNTYQDKEIYINETTGEKLVYQYYGHGGLGGSTRIIRQDRLTDNINLIEACNLKRGIWKVLDENENYLRTDTVMDISIP
ncbi:MAG: hypothetical protein WC760_08260 [Bacteroidia bacterium]|jgi:hypothetical protein